LQNENINRIVRSPDQRRLHLVFTSHLQISEGNMRKLL